MRRCLRLAVLGLLAAQPAGAQITEVQITEAQITGAQPACPALLPRAAPPAEAVPGPVATPYWRQRLPEVERLVASTDLPKVRLLFLGDSITQGWPPALFQHFYGHRDALNMGLGSDTTQGLLWRLARSPLGGALKPNIIVLLIGTNNAHNPRSDEVALGMAETLRFLRQRSPASRILLVGLLPRGATFQDPLRASVQRINALVAACADNASIFYANPGPMLLDGSGTLPDTMAPDRLHLSPLGYAVLAAGLEPVIRRLLGEP